jgi:2'-5' RNA ligase
MAEAVNEALSLLSFPKEQFTPHITIARAKNPGSARTILQRARESQEKGSVRMVVKECVLMQSILTPTGPIYRALEQMKMGGKNG